MKPVHRLAICPFEKPGDAIENGISENRAWFSPILMLKERVWSLEATAGGGLCVNVRLKRGYISPGRDRSSRTYVLCKYAYVRHYIGAQRFTWSRQNAQLASYWRGSKMKSKAIDEVQYIIVTSHPTIAGGYFGPFVERNFRWNCCWKQQRLFDQARFWYVTLTHTAWHRFKPNTSAPRVWQVVLHTFKPLFSCNQISPPAIVGLL